MQRPAWRALVATAVLLVLAGGPVAHAAPAFTCGTGWQVIPSPTVNTGSLNGVVPIPGTTQLWAVGSTYSDATETHQIALIERWNGAAWGVVPTPLVLDTSLSAVSTDATNDAWAVGYGNTPSTLLMHWNGTAWSVVPSPNVFGAMLGSVAAISPTDAWAVGLHYQNQPLIEHWNGSMWSVVAGASVLGGGNLSAVARIPGTAEVVAVGVQGTIGMTPTGTLIERWNGHKWTVQPSPNGIGPLAQGSSILDAVRAISPTNIWAAGYYTISPDGQNFFNQSLIEHWNGVKWSLSPGANATNQGAQIGTTINGITTVNGTDIWTVGIAGGWPSGGSPHAMSQQWNGSTWSLVMTPPGIVVGTTQLNAVAHIPGTSQIWAVGGGPLGQPLIEARC